MTSTAPWLDAESVAELTPDCEARLSTPGWDREVWTCQQPARLVMRTRCTKCGHGRITLRCSAGCAPRDCYNCRSGGGMHPVVVLDCESL